MATETLTGACGKCIEVDNAVELCHFHAAAPRLFAALEQIAGWTNRTGIDARYMQRKAREALAELDEGDVITDRPAERALMKRRADAYPRLLAALKARHDEHGWWCDACTDAEALIAELDTDGAPGP